MDKRLTKDVWLDHGLRVLAKSGPEGLKADTLAKSLGVTRGSFYWHFQDVEGYKKALLRRWQTVTTDQVIRDLEAQDAKRQRLGKLMQRAFVSGDRLERAVRSWAVQSRAVRRAVARVDTVRIDYLRQLLKDSGLTRPQARVRAVFLYAASLGRSHVWNQSFNELRAGDISTMAKLFESNGPSRGSRE